MKTIKFMAMMLMGILLSMNQVWAADLVINTENFNSVTSGSGYTSYNGTHKISGINITSNQVMVNAGKIQLQANAGYLYNTEALPGDITSITLDNGTNCLIVVGTSANPTGSSISSGSAVEAGKRYFKIAANNITATATSITITYDGSSVDSSIDNIIPNNAFWGTSYSGSFTGLSASEFTKTGTSSKGISITINNGNATTGYVTDAQTRAYSGYSLAFTAPSGYNIIKIAFSQVGSGNWNGAHTASVGEMRNNMLWVGNASAVTINFNGTCYIASIAVTLESSGPKAPVITAQPTGATYGQGDVATAMSITATGATSYQWYSNTTNNNTSGTAIIGATTASYTPSTTATGTTYYYCVATNSAGSTASNTATIVVNAPAVKHTVTWSVNGNTSWTTEVAEGADIAFTAPTSNIPDGYVFKGWYGSNYGPSDAAPTFVTSAIMGNTDKIYYAVFAIQGGSGADGWNKVTTASQIYDGGQYILAGTDDTNGYKAAKEFEGGKNTNVKAVDASVSDGVIMATGAATLTLAATDILGTTYYTIHDGTNYWYANGGSLSTAKNQLMGHPTIGDDGRDYWTITINGEGVLSIVNKVDSRGTMQYNYNGGTPLFNCYGSASQKAVELYVLSSGATYSDYRTAVGPTCIAVPTIGSVQPAAGTTSSVVLTCAGVTAIGANCEITSYGYVYGSGDAPGFNGEGTVKDGYTKIELGTTYTTPSTAFENYTVNGVASGSKTYFIAYAINGAGIGVSGRGEATAKSTKDYYIDNVQSTDGYTGTGKIMNNSYLAPALADVVVTAEQKASGTCEQQHYHFVGWVVEANKSNPTKSNIISAGTAMTAEDTPKNYYAVWAKEAE